MAIKFDQHKAKHQLLHVSISLFSILICISYVQKNKSWQSVGKFWGSLIIPIVLSSESAKLALAKYFGRKEKEIISTRQKRKSYGPTIIKDIFGGVLLQVVCVVLYAFVCIILGAPVLQNYEQTFVLSLLLTLLTISPTVLLLGVGGALQVVFCEKAEFLTKSEETALELYKYSAAGAVFGAWTGSAAAPLDWDRDWQIYPVPNIFGALLGCGVANIYCCSKVLFTTGKMYLNKKRM